MPVISPSSSKRNALANLAGYLVPVLISFFVSPFMLRTLGDSRYGILALISELTGYYALFDLGVRGAVGYYVARHTADGDWGHLQGVVNLAFWILSAAATVVLAVGLAIAWNIPSLFRIGDTDPSEVRTAASIVVVAVALNLPLAMSGAFLNGFRRLDLLVFSETALRCAGTLGIVLLLKAGYGLGAIAACQATALLGAGFVQYLMIRRAGVRIPLWPIHWRHSTFRDVFKVAGANVVLNSAVALIGQIQPLIIGAFISTAVVTYFVVPRQLILNYHYFISTITQALTTTFTYHYSSNNLPELRRLYMRAARLTGSLALFVGVSIILFGGYFLRLWIGDKYTTGDPLFRSDIVLILLACGTLLRTFQNISGQLLLATRQLRYLTILRVSEAVATVGLTFALIGPFGLVGVCLATIVPMIVSHAALFVHTLRTFDLNGADYWTSVVVPAVKTAGAAAVSGLLLIWLSRPLDWRTFLLECTLVLAVYLAAYWKAGLTAEDRLGARAQWFRLLGAAGLA